MCLAIYKPAKVKPDWDALEEGFRSNAHGAGFAVRDGQVRIYKGFFTFDEFAKAYRPLEKHQALIHFRWATHGNRTPVNCHPFRVTDELVMIHNGVLNIDCDIDKAMSDTWHYVEHILRPMALRDRDFFLHDDVRFLGEAAISGSKFAFLRDDGQFGIWNQTDGLWRGGAWYSNRSFEKAPLRIGFSRSLLPAREKPVSELYDHLTLSQQWAWEELMAAGYSEQELQTNVCEYGRSWLEQQVEVLHDLEDEEDEAFNKEQI